ncbi:MAG: 4-hydroxy-tetrahydrodipicolinate synthase [Propionibacteriaceae bacterium]|jgi:4-hydroxy-tetrahydrodipicolinate synthase|nr:4-hydroxy-tetrahydrodipicolinate synthase [Propionibacteriaceae bacterium]
MFKPHGIVPALVTPLTADGELLEDGLKDLIDHVIAGGVQGVFVLGSSGEIYGLSQRQKQRVVELTVEHVAGRTPIYAGASEITTRDCVQTAQMVARIGGVAALSVLTPYFMTPTQPELIQHYRTIAAATDLPVVLYSNPGRTQVRLALPTVLELAQVDNIVGIKDSGGDLSLTSEYICQTADDFAVLMGRDTLIYAALAHGADGAIASTGNIVPRLLVDLYQAYRAGRTDLALALQRRLTPLRDLVDVATFPVVLKEGLRLVGVEAGHCFAPARDLDFDSRRRLSQVIAELNGPTTGPAQ